MSDNGRAWAVVLGLILIALLFALLTGTDLVDPKYCTDSNYTASGC